MNTTDHKLQSKVDALDCLLADPRPDDEDWSEQVLCAFELVTQYTLHPGVPVCALSRSVQFELSAASA